MKHAWLYLTIIASLLTIFTPTVFAQVDGGISIQGSYDLQNFQRDEQDAIYWQQRYNAAPTGSWEESDARNRRDQSIQRALMSLRSPSAFQSLYSGQVEQFAAQMDQKYNAAQTGSALESMYREAQTLAYNGLRQALQIDLNNAAYDWRNLQDLALRFEQAYNQAATGSKKESAYRDVMSQAFQRLPQSVDQEIAGYWDFQQVEQVAFYFEQQYNAASTGSTKEATYRQIMTHSFDQAVSKAQSQLASYPAQSLYQIQAQYEQLYNQASTGSTKESYFRRIRDIARNLLGRY